ncbi:carbohydrate transporter, putative [Ricinus communis]|uniref:Carbohydrate transporter, putative n=1 Tax=Ricinus communis TaxID=3988 RepID=B9SGI0_RICCO|nr:carbohydrate transporter, putative [Ricinus communis]
MLFHVLTSSSVFGQYFALHRTRKIFGVSLSLILINLAAIMERADENLLPAVYKEVSETFNAGPSDLGYLTFIRNFVQGLSSPLAGVLVINYDRPTVLAMGTFCWALSTAAVGASHHFLQVAFWRGVNGFGLAIVIPALQSFIADSYMEGVRGAGFGLVNLIGNLGGIGGGVLATVMAGQQYWGIPGWRCAFIMMATLSSIIGFLVFLFVIDPRKTISIPRDTRESFERDELIERSSSSASSVWTESWTAMQAVIKVKTFQIIVLQGIVGSLPWTAMVFFAMWFELIGFSHNSTAFLLSLFAVGCALGSLIGGLIADRLSHTYPHSGRIMCAQFSALMGIPFSWFLLKEIPLSVSSYHTFAVTIFMMGLTISWNGTAANAPMFAEVVPVKHRTMIYAFDRAFEGSLSSFAAPLVGILSEKMFGYDSKSIDPVKGSVQEASALSKGLLSMMAVPFGLCCLFYTPLYKFFRQDRENARIASAKEAEMT